VQAETSVVSPETVDAYELGIKSEWLDERPGGQCQRLLLRLSDIQVNAVSVRDGQVVSLLTNAAQGVIRGAEFRLQALPLDNLHLNASVGLLHTSCRTSSPAAWTSGNRIARSPARTCRWARYRIRWPAAMP
jgi:iron complex outermembrane receptor protein